MNTSTMALPDSERGAAFAPINSVDAVLKDTSPLNIDEEYKRLTEVNTIEKAQREISPKGLVLPFINFILLTGPKGGGKTSLLVRFAIVAHFIWRVPVFADFPIAGIVGGKYFEVQPLPMDVFLNYGHGIPPGSVLIVDEFQEFFDRQGWQAVAQKFGTSMAQQIRHLRLVVVGAMQYLNYLNPRLNDQIDLMIKCQDLRFTEWGVSGGIGRGKESILHYYDMCGGIDVAGSARNPYNPHMVTGDPYRQALLYIKAYREYFDTTRLTGIEQRFRQYQIKKEKIMVPQYGAGGNGNEPDEPTVDLIRMCLDDAANEGKERVSASEILGRLRKRGKRMIASELGGIVSQMSIDKTLKQGRAFYSTGLEDQDA
jgi:hypothetical protein